LEGETDGACVTDADFETLGVVLGASGEFT
jgi:hypothetical protein